MIFKKKKIKLLLILKINYMNYFIKRNLKP